MKPLVCPERMTDPEQVEKQIKGNWLTRFTWKMLHSGSNCMWINWLYCYKNKTRAQQLLAWLTTA